MTGPCSGIRVVDLTSMVAGPFCSAILSDLGAEVIKVESPGSDLIRGMGPSHMGLSAGFELFNRGKKSFAVSLKSEDGRAQVRELVATADVFLHNSRPGVMERLGLDFDTLIGVNPGLIYAVVSGYGETGPYAGRPAYDGVIQGLTGFMPVQGGEGEPSAVMSPIVDKVTSVWAANAILAALVHRGQTGEGQKVVVSLLGAYTAFMLTDLMLGFTFHSLGLNNVPSTAIPTYRLLDTADGKVIGLVLQQNQFEGFCRALKREDLLQDPRFSTASLRSRHVGLLYDEIAITSSTMPTEAFLVLMAEHGAPFAKVNSIEEFFEDPQVKHAQCYVEFDDPEYGRIRHLNYPGEFSASPVDVRRRAPKLGEHTGALMAELAGRREAAIPAE